MAIGIEVSAGGPVFEDMTISDFDVGISLRNSHGGVFNRLQFNNVRHPWDVEHSSVGVSGTRISNDPKSTEPAGKSMVGYRRPNGPPLPAMCPQCRTVFPSKNYNVGSSRFYGFDNEDTCPKCRCEHAKLVEGIFDLGEEVARIIEGEPLTHAMFAAIAHIAKQMSSGELPASAAIEEVARVSPGLGAVFKRYMTCPTTLAWLSLFVTTLGIALPYLWPAQQEDTCAISESFQRDGRSTRYEIRTTAEKCLQQLAKVEIFLNDDTIEQESGIPPQNEPPEKAPSPEVSNDTHSQPENSREGVELPMRGPLPLDRPENP
ncbi:hypothetical protein C7U60_02720 [Mesorhizobium plurifarium]|uniref:hypothetical protein n=1 Tax=Sinorhizobium arboris TaxID=76745 RepID=UPI000D4EE376|nr:hypothetical protein [Sinorhizobium arboris]PST27215.1 hypothetical protein C7U60_02720 [Mesorhizobium plurifarium]